MSDRETPTDRIYRKLAALGRKDRQAVLARLSDEERHALTLAIDETAEREAAERERQRRIERQFLGYSPWLASRVEAAKNARTNALTELATETLWQQHELLIGEHPPAIRSGWLGVFDRLSDLLEDRRGRSS